MHYKLQKWVFRKLAVESPPGWYLDGKPRSNQSGKIAFLRNMWVQCRRPRNGIVSDIMTRTCATYHYTISSLKRHKQDIVNERFARAILSYYPLMTETSVRIRLNIFGTIRFLPVVLLIMYIMHQILRIFSLTNMRIYIHVLVFVLWKWTVLELILLWLCYLSQR